MRSAQNELPGVKKKLLKKYKIAFKQEKIRKRAVKMKVDGMGKHVCKLWGDAE